MRANKIHQGVIGDLEVPPSIPRERWNEWSDRIMERGGVETVVSHISQGVLVIHRGQVCGGKESRGQLHGSLTTTATKISGEHIRCEGGAYGYKDPNVFPPVTSPVMKIFFFPSPEAHPRTPAAHIEVASSKACVALSTTFCSPRK